MNASLTPGERLVRCLTGGDIDRVPFGIGLGWSPWGATHEKFRLESGISDLNVYKYLQYEPSFALPKVEYGCQPGFPEEILERTDEFVISRNRQGCVMKNRLDRGSMPDFLDYPVKSPDDWERLKRERYQMRDDRIQQDWEAFRDRIRTTGEAVQVGVFPWGVFGTVRDLLGAEEVLLAFYDYPDMVHDMMTTLTDLWIAIYERVAAQVQIDHIHIWEDMAGRQGSLISPAMVEEFMMPCYDKIVAFARAHGVRVISVDTDGDCAQLVPVFMKHGINMMFPFEVAAGNDILAYRRQYPTLGIIGGLDKRALAGTRADVDREIAKCAAMLKLGRYIPAFDHLIAPDATWDNFNYAAEQIRALCHATTH
jgi:uroporphyrinogen decarboxylase